MKCPKCGSRKVAPILYGMPAFDEDTVQQIQDKKLFLGGCIMSAANPRYHCFGCGKNVGTPPILLGKEENEDYRDIVTGIHFSVGGYLSGSKDITIKKRKSHILLEISSWPSSPSGIFRREMKQDEWDKLVDRLYRKLYLHEWKKSYTELLVLDGDQWDLEIKLTNGRSRHYHGDNAYPPYWRELQTAFRPFFDESGIE